LIKFSGSNLQIGHLTIKLKQTNLFLADDHCMAILLGFCAQKNDCFFVANQGSGSGSRAGMQSEAGAPKA
jgi:hypothetical protein